MVTRVVDGHFVKSQLKCLFNMLKITLLGGDTEVIRICEPALVRRQRLIVSIYSMLNINITGLRHFLVAIRSYSSSIGSSCHLAVQRSGDC